jgi:2',3'-cyclic-nucleotide 2'-phosphodiesterase (5'-nucleotidase family)
VWCDILCKLFPLVNAPKQNLGDKTRMRYLHSRTLLLRVTATALLLVSSASFAVAQSQAIEPCQASPTPQAGSTPPAKISSKVSQTAIDSSIANDPALDKIVSAYSSKVRELSVVIGNLEGELKKSGVGGASIGNFVTDAMTFQARLKGKPAAIAITNAGGLRKNSIAPGQLRASDIFELLPFENALVEVEVTGAQLLKLLENLTRSRDAQSGARIQFRWNAEDRPEFISAKLIGSDGVERDIKPTESYTLLTIDYLLKVASGNYAILLEARNPTPLNMTIRDAVMEYVKAEAKAGRPIRAVLDNRFVQVGPGPSREVTSPND